MAAKKAKKKAVAAAPKHPSKAAKLVAKVAKAAPRPIKKPKLADAVQAAELYRVIRERKAAGGKGWEPP